MDSSRDDELSAAEKPGEPVEESALLAGRLGSAGILRCGRFLVKNHLKPFIDDALDFLV